MSERKLLGYQVNFENLAFVRIPKDCIGIIIYQSGSSPNYNGRHHVKQFAISIDRGYTDIARDALIEEEFGGTSAMVALREFSIVDIDCIWEGGIESWIYVDFSIGDMQNKYQRWKTNKHGDLFIEVSATAELDSIFPDDVINADDYTVTERQG